MWLIDPKHTMPSVAKELAKGLEDGSIILSKQAAMPDEPTSKRMDTLIIIAIVVSAVLVPMAAILTIIEKAMNFQK